MPRFAILRHDAPQGLHFDFLLETGDVLKTWALPRPPEPGSEMACEALPDHRPLYLDHEGPISGGRGSVSRWDRGTCEIVYQDESKWEIDLAGQRLSGRVTIQRSPENLRQWHFSIPSNQAQPEA